MISNDGYATFYCKKTKRSIPQVRNRPFALYGRGERIRTSDPVHPMHVRYQAALRPVNQRSRII